jgi:serine/threonine-protein phosphatase 2A activator
VGHETRRGTRVWLPQNVSKVLHLLDRLEDLVEETPLEPATGRFGNPAFKAWFAKMEHAAAPLLLEMLGDQRAPAVIELQAYLISSFGNATRIDYGSGAQRKAAETLPHPSLFWGAFRPSG